jgi:hypothetical protein
MSQVIAIANLSSIFHSSGTLPIQSVDWRSLAQESKSPDNPQFHYHLGMAYAKSGQPTFARQQLQLALKLNPGSSNADDAKKQLAELKLYSRNVGRVPFIGNSQFRWWL